MVGVNFILLVGGRKILLGFVEVCVVKFIIGEKENLCDGCVWVWIVLGFVVFEKKVKNSWVFVVLNLNN